MACKLDLEGVVAKPKQSPYRRLDGKPLWVKVKNLDYSQAVGLTLEPGQRELRRRPALPIREPCRKFGRKNALASPLSSRFRQRGFAPRVG